MRTTKADRKQNYAHSLAELREILKPGDVVYTALRHISKSGTMRHIDVLAARKDVHGEPYIRNISWLVANVLDYSTTEENSLKVGGGGMDMGFHVVYSLSRTMFDGTEEGGVFRCIGEGCPSNDHSNDYGDLARKYDTAHAKASAAASAAAEGQSVEEFRATRIAYVAARQAWIAEREAELRSPTRVHSDGGYALSQRWI